MSNRPGTAASIGAGLGRVVLAMGLFLLGFAGYQLWGTGLAEANAQNELAEELAARLLSAPEPVRRGAAVVWPETEPGIGTAASPIGPVHRPVVEPVVVEPQAPAPIAVGQPFARLRIPAIDVDKTVVEGTTREALRSGPGHYLGTARPGQAGNVAIAGHRTTYGAPFHDIDRLAPGDPILIETEDGVFTYRVEARPGPDGEPSGHRIVAPEAVEVIADQGDHRLTLTACHPRYSARQRIVVTAVLDGPTPTTPDASPRPDPGPEPAPDRTDAGSELVAAPVTVSVRVPTPIVPTGLVADRGVATDPGDDSGSGEGASHSPEPPMAAPAGVGWDDDLGWQPAHAPASLAWATLSVLVVGVAWLLGRLWRRTPAYLMAGPSLTLCLVTCFSHLDRLIPAT